MKQLSKYLVLILALALFSCSKNVDDIIKKNFEARGGDKLNTIKNVLYEGKATSMGFDMPFKLYILPPDKLRYEIEALGSKIVTIANGSRAWQIDSTAHEIPTFRPETVKETMDYQQKTFESDLINFKEKGSKAVLLPEDTVNGKKAYKIKMILKDSSEIVYFLDKDSYLELKSITKTKIMGQQIEQTIYFNNYKKVGDFNIAHKWVYKMKDEKGTEQVSQVLEYKNIKVNQDFGTELFAEPPGIVPPKENEEKE